MRFRSRTEAELAALKELSGSRRDVTQTFNPGLTSDSSGAFRSRTEAELASLKELKNSKANVVQAYNTEVKPDSAEPFRSRNEAELQALQRTPNQCEASCAFTLLALKVRAWSRSNLQLKRSLLH
jgi:hypothetical protein